MADTPCLQHGSTAARQHGQPARSSRPRKSTLETGVGVQTTLTDTPMITPDGWFQGSRKGTSCEADYRLVN